MGSERTHQAELTASRYIAQRETGPWGDEDAAAFQRWLDESTLHRVVYFRLNAAWQESGRLKALHVPGTSPVALAPGASSISSAPGTQPGTSAAGMSAIAPAAAQRGGDERTGIRGAASAGQRSPGVSPVAPMLGISANSSAAAQLSGDERAGTGARDASSGRRPAPGVSSVAPTPGVAPLTPSLLSSSRVHAGVLRNYAIAASLLLAAFGLLAAYWYINVRNTYSTAIGIVQAVPLPDGSRVTLNTDSRLRVALDTHTREIELIRGEAFFDVAHDPARPFIVTAGKRHIVAVGTRFSVRRDGDDVRVVVTEGAVRFENATDSGSFAGSGLITSGSGEVSLQRGATDSSNVLSAGTVAVAADAGIAAEKHPLTDVEQSLSWREGLLTFRNTSLADAVAEFNRYNTRKIIIRDPAVAKAKVGGIFGATQPLRFVRLIEHAFAVQAIVEEDRIVLTARK